MGIVLHRPQETASVAINNVGGLTITDGVVTGFTSSKFLQTAEVFDRTKKDYELVCRFKYTSGVATTANPIFCNNASSPACKVYQNKVEIWLRFVGESSSTQYLFGSVETDAIYIFIFRRVNGQYYEATLQKEYTGEIVTSYTWNRTEDLYSEATGGICLGGGLSATDQYMRGEIYLEGTYIKIDGNLWAGTLPQEVNPSNLIIDDGVNQNEANYLILNDKLVWANPKCYLSVSQTPTSPTKYVRTNIQLNSSSKVEIIFKPSQYSNNYALWCCRTQPTTKTFTVFNITGNYRFDYYSSQTNFGSSTSLVKTNITVDGNKAYINGGLKTTVTAQTFTPDYGMILFASNTGGGTTYNNGYQGRFYSMKIYLDGINLSYYFVPVPSGMTIGSYTTPSEGIFDIVNQQFYANSGSGTFTWGKDQ